MSVRDITQEQALALIRPLFEYLDVDEGDVSNVTFTAGAVDITRYTEYGSVKQHIKYVGG